MRVAGAPPNRPISRILSRAVIYLGPALPPASCGPPGTWRAACKRPGLALLPAEVGRFTPGAYSCLFPEGVSQAPGIVTVPLFLPFVGRTDVGRRVLPAAVLGGVRTFLPDAMVGRPPGRPGGSRRRCVMHLNDGEEWA